LLTIGDRFGGALDESAAQFTTAFDEGLTPSEFVTKMAEEKKLIMGIGHKVKSLQNPDKRVSIIKEYAKKNFKDNSLLDYALKVEKITTQKKQTLILNVDGCNFIFIIQGVATCFVDLLRSCGSFEKNEIQDYIDNGCLNGLFVLGRTIGFIGHHLDQKRLKQGLYRHPTDDINYFNTDE
jgi:ATP citrate (pro-S)-lyase